MKSRIVNTSFFVLIQLISVCQNTDTVFVNEDWKKTTRDKAKYYRFMNNAFDVCMVEYYHLNHKLYMQGAFAGEGCSLREGKFNYYNKEGELISERNFRSDKEDGKSILYNKGKVYVEKIHDFGSLVSFKAYHPNGVLKREELYEEKLRKVGKCYSVDGRDTIFFEFEEMPKFNGGIDALKEYIVKSVKYPKKARKKNIAGKVIVRFVVGVDGSVEEATVVNPIDPLLDEEALRVVAAMPTWIPGKQDGKPVRIYFNLPINFKFKD